MGWENNMSNIYGNFVWWQGVVEYRLDPLMLGRCKVRILGYHTDNTTEGSGIPTEHLPWATMMQPTTSAAISGIGTTPTGPVEGTWVIGFFRDGEDAQEPVIMGTIGGRPEEGPVPNKGFNDPDCIFPKDSYLRNDERKVRDGSIVPKEAEQDTNRLARGNLSIPTIDQSSITDESVPLTNGENAESLIWKRSSRQEAVQKALAGNLISSIENTGEPFYAQNSADLENDPFSDSSNLGTNFDVSGEVTGFEITNGGSKYTSAPTVVIENTGSGGSGLSVNAYITGGGTPTGGVVSSIIIIDAGSGYTSAPSISFSGGGGTGATAVALIEAIDEEGISIRQALGEESGEWADIDNPNYYWNEPHPRYGGVKKSKTVFETELSSCYPFNHVRASESGHVEEWDDTPGAERLHKYHKSGTFEEIQTDGTKITKVVMDDYEIVAGEKNVLIHKRSDLSGGDLNITVEGNCRLLTMGSLVQEVRGNYHLNVLKDMRVKVGGNMVQEIMSARKIKVEKDDDLKVGKSKVVNVGVNLELQAGKNISNIAGGNWMVEATNCGVTAGSGTQIIGNVTCDIIGAKVGLASAVLTKIESDVHIQVSATSETHALTAGYICGVGAGWVVKAVGLASIGAGAAISLKAGKGISVAAGLGISIKAGLIVKVTGSFIKLN
jgi:hypothetical protein